MKKQKIMLIIASAAAIILELLPYGAVLNFANPEGEPYRSTYSYFSLTPFGYANFGPLITAVLTCVLLTLSVIYLYKNRQALGNAIRNLSLTALLLSLTPLLYGLDYFSALGAVISCTMLVIFCLSVYKPKA